ncbi:MAG: tyrosine-type recombinase/integrase [Armatimonadia bacterium]
MIYYFRVGKGARVRLPDDPSSPAFDRAYTEALAAHLTGVLRRPEPRTLAWLVEQYRESPQYAALAPETRKQFRYQLARMVERAGEAPLSEITQESIVKGRDARREKPTDANKYLRASVRLFAFAVEHGWMRENPAHGVRKIPLPNRQTGFLAWEEEDVTRFEERWPVGTRERLALDLLLYTGVRRSDVVRLGRQHMRRNGEIVIRTEKSVNSGRPIEVTITILPPLARSIAATATGELTFLVTARGRPWVKESFGNWFKAACRAAGIAEDGKAAHGLRKVAASRAAEAGATEAELNAMFGWMEGSGEAAHYIRKANRAKLARSGNAKIMKMPQAIGKQADEL